MAAQDCRVLLRWLSDSSDPQLLDITASSLRELANSPESRASLLVLDPLPALCAATSSLKATHPATACILGRTICQFACDPPAAETLLRLGASSLLLDLIPIGDAVHEWPLSTGVTQLAARVTPALLDGLVPDELSKVAATKPVSFLHGELICQPHHTA